MEINEILDALIGYMKKGKVRYMRIFFPNLVEVHRKLAERVRVIEKKTHINALNIGKENVWENLRTFCKKNIKKAEKSNLSIIYDDDFKLLPEYVKLVRQLYDDQGMICPKPLQLYEQLYGEENRKNIKVLFVTHNEKIIGGLILALSKKMVNAIDTAVLSEYKHLQPGTYIFWKGMEWCMENGYENFDFTGSDIERLAQFKANFGGVLTRYSCVELAHPHAIFKARELYTAGKYKLTHAAYAAERMSAAAGNLVLRPLYGRVKESLTLATKGMRTAFESKRGAKQLPRQSQA